MLPLKEKPRSRSAGLPRFHGGNLVTAGGTEPSPIMKLIVEDRLSSQGRRLPGLLAHLIGALRRAFIAAIPAYQPNCEAEPEKPTRQRDDTEERPDHDAPPFSLVPRLKPLSRINVPGLLTAACAALE
jgi:hypothetical protein